MDNSLRAVCSMWATKIHKAWEHKQKLFGDDAEEAMKFFNGPYEFMYSTVGRGKAYLGDEEIPAPSFRMTVNKVAEMVQLFGPALYHQNPTRTVKPRTPPDLDPQDIQMLMQLLSQQNPELAQQLMLLGQQQDTGRLVDEIRAKLLGHYLNYTPLALDLKTESRWAIDEAIIKGMGCLSGGTEVYAKLNGEHTVIRVRDLARVTGEAYLWDGQGWNLVIGVRRKDRVGDELKVCLRSGEEINCTTDHPWPTQRGLLRADELTVGDTLEHVRLAPPLKLKETPEHLPDNIGWLVGLYLGDGWLLQDKGGAFQVASHINETESHAKLTALALSYGARIAWKGKEGTKCWNATIYSHVLVAILRTYVAGHGAYKKHLRQACWNRSDAFLQQLLDGYLDSDGHWIEDEEIWRLHFCDNKQLAGNIRTLCARLGLRLTLRRGSQKLPDGSRYPEYLGVIRTRAPKSNNAKHLGEIVSINPANWRRDYYYDIALESSPHTYALASGLITHNCLWTELYTPTGGGRKLVGNFYDSIDNLVIDPDAENIHQAKWIARRCMHPYWEVERDYGLPQDTLKNKGTVETTNNQAAVGALGATGDYRRKQGLTNDLLVYWKIWSRMGVGGRLTGIAPNLREPLDAYGDNTYLVIAENVPWPLNLPPPLDQAVLAEEPQVRAAAQSEIAQRVQWPIPFWADDAWPFTELSFHPVPRQVWPMSHVKPALGELKFLNWAFSFLCGKIRIASRDFIAIAKSASEELRERIKHGPDYTIIEVEQIHESIDKVCKFLTHPPFNAEIYKIIEGVMENFERRTGLTELMYGQSAVQLRSAQEANLKSQHASIRPDDMAAHIEDAMTEAARKEAFAARWLLVGSDVEPVMGPLGARFWDLFLTPSDPAEILHSLEYRIEAGSTRKPNKALERDNMQQAMQSLLQTLWAYTQMTGNVTPLNGLVSSWAKSIDLDPAKFLLTPPPPPVAPPGPEAPAGKPAQGAPQ